MRKKILGILGFAGLMLAATSCSDDLKMNVGGEDGDIVQVTFTLSKEGALGTRADGNVHYPKGEEFSQISDGSKATRLVWAVYDKDGNLLPEIGINYNGLSPGGAKPGYGQVVEDIEEFPHEITLSLIQGQEYSFAFWAQDPECKAFNTDNLRAVSIDYMGEGNNLANDELRDAFCKVETFTVSSAASMTRTIILKRPFAQVNVGIPASEYESLRQSGIRIKKSKIHMENVATEFDVVSNSTHGDDPTKRQAIDLEYNYIPAYYNWNVQNDTDIPTDDDLRDGRDQYGKTQDLKIDLNHDGTIEPYGKKNGEDDDESARDETYNYMVMAYILPADRNDGTSTYSTTLDRVEFSLQTEKVGQADLTFSLENVPVQRNWRTNIFGRMFTSNVILEIDLDPIYSGDYNYPEWQRIYEGVTYDAMADCIYISNGAGLAWLSMATNGKWATQDAFEADNSHNKGALITNSGNLMLEATDLNEWPEDGIFNFKDVTIKLDADIDLNVYANLFENDPDNYYFTPIGFGSEPGPIQNNVTGGSYFAGIFDGQNHTIYNLRTVRPSSSKDGRAFGFFSVIGRTAKISNLRLKNIDIQSNYFAGGIAGYAYGSVPGWDEDVFGNVIENCYIDGGTITSTSRKIEDNEYDDANNVGGILGIMYNSGSIQNCNVRNVTIRAYRALSGLLGQNGGDYYREHQYVKDNKVYNIVLIADQFQEYGTDNNANKTYEIVDFFVAKQNDGPNMSGNEGDGNILYAFDHPVIDGSRTTTIDDTGLLSNPPLDIFPRMVGRYTDKVLFKTSVLGGPSAWKIYEGQDENVYKGTPNKDSGRVGLWVSQLTIDGATGNNLLDNSTITAAGLQGKDDCVMFIKNYATINNLTVRGADYANQGICMAPEEGMTIELNGVLAYDAKKVLTDDGNVTGGTLTVVNSNFRGYVKLSEGYNEITFTETTFDGSTKRYDNSTTNKVEIAGKAKFNKCKFLVEAGNDYVIEVGANSEFEDCMAYVIGKTEVNDGLEVKGNCKISVDDDGTVMITAIE